MFRNEIPPNTMGLDFVLTEIGQTCHTRLLPLQHFYHGRKFCHTNAESL